jgi:excisionase family DNA binding protein
MTITIPAQQTSGIRIPAKPAPQPKPERTVETPLIGVTIPKAAKMLGISRNTFMPLIQDGRIRTVRIGKRIIVCVQSLHEFMGDTKKPCGTSEKKENHRDTKS